MRRLGARSESERGLVRRSLRGLAGQGIVRIVGRDGEHDLASAIVELADSRAVGASYRDSRTLVHSPTADALRAICRLDLGELEVTEPPRGYGRD
jgi:hypothetical protein